MMALIAISGWLASMFPHGDHNAAKIEATRTPLAQRLATRGFHIGDPAYIRIFKSENRLELWLAENGRYRPFETYPICAWSGRLGPKLKEGDGQAPEGFYSVSREQMNPHSEYDKAFNIGFPNAFDRANGRSGSFLMVHGNCASAGCFAMTDPGIEEIYGLMAAAFAHGQRSIAVDALPFPLSATSLAMHSHDAAIGFWRQLAKGQAEFARLGAPPAVFVCNRRYAFSAGQGCLPVREAR
jgi:murein L,D-transpeptidase YafK